MAKKKTDQVMPEMPNVEIAGKTYPLKRIPARMAYDILPVLEQAIGGLDQYQQNKASGTALTQYIVSLIRRNADTLDDLFAHLLGVKTSDFNDGERFPLNTQVRICSVLGDHPDLRDFLTDAQALWADIPTNPLTGETSGGHSNSSGETEDSTAGQTEPS